MPFRMDRGTLRTPKYPFVQVKPGRSAFIVFTCGPGEIEGTPLHWLGNEAISVPCGRETCRYCPDLPVRYQWFAAVMEWWVPGGFAIGSKPFKSGCWRKAILRITEHLDDIMLDDLTGKVCEVFRAGPNRNSPLNWKLIEPIPDRFRFELSKHDIMPTLYAVWHMYRDLRTAQDLHNGEETA